MNAASVHELLAARRQLVAAWDALGPRPQQELWFRGVSRAHPLLPGIFRADNEDLDEATLVNHFRSIAPTLLEREPIDDWEWYFAAQHYGLPTRLLDWTENLLVALYFALADHKTGASVTGRAPCIWIMDAATLNKISLGDDDYDVMIPGGPLSHRWLPPCEQTRSFKNGRANTTNRRPIAIFPRRTNPRILAQQGVFTLHGTARVPLENVFAAAPKADRRIARIDLKIDKSQTLLHERDSIGLTRFSVFPEIQGVAEHIKDNYRLK